VRGAAIEEWGGREKIQVRDDLADPPVGPDFVRFRVRAAGLNPVDWKIREGRNKAAFPFRFPLILGWDAAGVVEKVGPAVTEFQPGDEVMGCCRRHELHFGTYAELVCVPEDFLAHKPAALSFEQAAGLPLVGLTAHQALERIGLRAKETLLVAAGAGGVGHLAVQLAVVRGARVIAVASERNHAWLRQLGAEPVDYAGGSVTDAVRALAPAGVDAAFDVFGGDAREVCFDVLRQGGRLVSIAGPPPESREGAEAHYVFVRPRGHELAELGDLAGAGRLTVHVEEAFPLDRAADAHERLEGGHVRGKLVLTL